MTKRSFQIRFFHQKRANAPQFENGKLALVPVEFYRIPYTVEECEVYVFQICVEGQIAGELCLRMGEGDAIFYLGHIGYHVDPPFRGHHYAALACELVKPVFECFRIKSFVITTDPDNVASIKTCQRIGCRLESTVQVPRWCQKAYECSSVKNRYVFSQDSLSV